MKSSNHLEEIKNKLLLTKREYISILRNQPEIKLFKETLSYLKSKPGYIVVIYVLIGINSFQLKGNSQENYWPSIAEFVNKNKERIRNYIEKNKLKELGELFKKFYSRERLSELKIKRIEKLVSNDFLLKISRLSLNEIQKEFKDIHKELARILNQSLNAKTIVFAMKCIGEYLLLMNKQVDTTQLVIPVDSRIRRITQGILHKELSRKEIIEFWKGIEKELRRRKNYINIILIDSYLWQKYNELHNELVKKKKFK